MNFKAFLRSKSWFISTGKTILLSTLKFELWLTFKHSTFNIQHCSHWQHSNHVRLYEILLTANWKLELKFFVLEHWKKNILIRFWNFVFKGTKKTYYVILFHFFISIFFFWGGGGYFLADLRWIFQLNWFKIWRVPSHSATLLLIPSGTTFEAGVAFQSENLCCFFFSFFFNYFCFF